jgi:hypothetical protein
VGTDRTQHPPRIDRHGDHEQVHGEQEVDRFQKFHHAGRRAAIEVVDVEHDPVDPRQLVAGGVGVRCLFDMGLGQQPRHVREVLADLRHDAQVPAVVSGRGLIGDQPGQLPGRREVTHLTFQGGHLRPRGFDGLSQTIVLLVGARPQPPQCVPALLPGMLGRRQDPGQQRGQEHRAETTSYEDQILRALKLRALSPRTTEWETWHRQAEAFYQQHRHLDGARRRPRQLAEPATRTARGRTARPRPYQRTRPDQHDLEQAHPRLGARIRLRQGLAQPPR